MRPHTEARLSVTERLSRISGRRDVKRLGLRVNRARPALLGIGSGAPYREVHEKALLGWRPYRSNHLDKLPVGLGVDMER